MSNPQSRRASGGFTSSTHPNNNNNDSSNERGHPSLSALESTSNLSTLPTTSLTDDTLVSCLRERFMTDTIYTAIGTNSLVVVNPHKYVGCNSDSVVYKYAAEYADMGVCENVLVGEGVEGGGAGKKMPPHVFQLANNAYYHMRRTGQDQCIIFTGETASGKSEARRLAIKSLITLSVPPAGKKGSKLAQQIPASEFVLESFGNARTLFNPNASRFGKYTELQFTNIYGGVEKGGRRGRLCGVKTLDYYLERGRVAAVPSGERNFHIFYYLVRGVNDDERGHLNLGDGRNFRYLGGQRASIGGAHGLAGRFGHHSQPSGPGGHAGVPGRDEDALKFDQLKIALKTIGFSKRSVAQCMQLVAAILHLGNLDFTIDKSRNEDAAVVRNLDTLNLVADFLGVDPQGLEGALSYKTKMVKKELCTVFLDVEGAEANRDELAKTLYSLLFAWVNEYVNQRLAVEEGGAGGDGDFDAFIGLLDLPGPQNMSSRPNSLDQFIVNYANERVQGFVRNKIFNGNQQEFQFEGLTHLLPSLSSLSTPDNSETLRLLHNYPGGLIHIMDDQARRQPKKTDGTMVEAFQKRWGNHSSFKTSGVVDVAGAGRAAGAVHASGVGASFTVSHYNGAVTYAVEGFLERNLDSVNPDFVSLLRGTAHDTAQAVNTMHHTAQQAAQEGYGSINPFVKSLFSSKAIATQAHPRHEETIVAAQQAVKPMRAPSMRRKGTVRRGKRAGDTEGRMEGIEEAEGDEEGGATGVVSPFGGGEKDLTRSHTRAESQANNQNKDTPCVAGEFRAALDTLFATLDETQPWFVFCINPNDSQLPNQLEGRSVKGQVRSCGMGGVARRNLVYWEVNMTFGEFEERYAGVLEEVGVTPSSGEGVFGGSEESGSGRDKERALAEAFRALVVTNVGGDFKDVVLGKTKVWLSQRAFRALEDRLRIKEGGERVGRELGMAGAAYESSTVHGHGGQEGGGLDPYSPYRQAGEDGFYNSGQDLGTPGWNAGGYDQYNGSNQRLPLVSNASPFNRGESYDDEGAWRAGGKSDEEYEPPSRIRGDETDSMSNFGSESYAPSRNMFAGGDKGGGKKGGGEKAALAGELLAADPNSGVAAPGETTEVLKESSARRRWVAFTWLLTWWIPSPFLVWFGRMKRMDVRQAWREKLALNLIIWFICGCTVFVIAVLGPVICPTEHVYSTTELSDHSFDKSPNKVYTAIRGEVFDLTKIAAMHQRKIPVVAPKEILKYGGREINDLFPVQVSALCDGIDGNVSPYVMLSSRNVTDTNAVYHDFRASTNDPRPDWYFQQMVTMRYTARVGFRGYTPKEIRNMANRGQSVAIYNGLVYDLTEYISTPPRAGSPEGTNPPPVNTQFMDGAVLELFTIHAGKDVTKELDELDIPRAVLRRQKTCLRNLFTIGKVDNRQSPQCLFSTYILLVLSIIMVSIIGFKFLASLNFGAARAPEDHDKFVICQVPCYTEGDQSLRRTIDSLAQLKYDDKRKLLLIICDGMIVGSGNDRPTPRIVLDILGADPNLDPEPLSFVSLGEGAKQHNMGKVYSGLYECSGHVVPYLVVVKVGKPTERSRPGNRGKRDSQMLLMHFLNKVHFNSPMNPLELEMYHQIKNVIGVNPSFYEYLFMVDADTTVEPLSLNRLISAMIHDKKLLGVCGETSLANAKQSIVTMMQVYEYFLSHHMAKAFESLFGSVTCLPGCFTLYRLRTPDTHKPLLISNQLIHDYSENRVDTLHMKNLLHLGEDRYLTTLLLKHFPRHKTQFVRDAHAFTVAPDDWKVLLSQRRRWINSTVHNLGELVFLDQLCGFCCFSMRFVVMIDLLSTITQPVTVAYIAYLIYLIAGQGKPIPLLSLIMIAAIYGIQALVFILRRKWDMIGWMIFYILAIPAFSFFLPLYSFWKMDDFSWGQTRVVLGESGKKVIVHDEGKFDPRAIPTKSWSDYENELWDKESNHSIGSWAPGKAGMGGGYAESRTASLYGRETLYEPQLPQMRSFSPVPSQLGMHMMSANASGGFGAPPAYGSASGRNTPQSMYGGGSPGVFAPAPSRPVTNYLDMPISGGFDSGFGGGLNAQHTGGGGMGGGPSDMELESAVQDVLRHADLNLVTKREVRRTLEERFGMDLTSRKATINAAIDRILSSS
ncbi:chitin synthase 8 [Coprinopsis cinerea okayama7|uniref:chitin synthase n=1 Tax=Coprinopsis cinerea (strain Okayama-7 / 130 / ATCC MYA-4618 / FGSC 9003) TaxID=240176 RepID=A8PDL5_COPC7|nr:chitin synthase 8 [Coprinopsis cinerea okayama7\|eukprot:XP_001840622.2 chitin synthase 8 [Coprinopsis cinerea okayama7\